MVANFDDDTKKKSETDTPKKPEKGKKAVALQYDKEKQAAPKVVAKGRDLIAQKIIEIAKEHDLHIHKDADLVEVLDKVEIDQEIPLEVYTVVAEIFAYIYRANQKHAGK